MIWSLLLACSPLLQSTPVTPLAADQTSSWSVKGFPILHAEGFAGDLSYRRGLASGDEIYAQLGGYVGPGIFPYLGGGWRRHLTSTDAALYAGLSVGAGGLWAQLSLPVSLRLTPRLQLTTQPALGYSCWGLVHLPAGLTADLGEHLQLSAEAGGWALSLYTEPFLYGALGLSWTP